MKLPFFEYLLQHLKGLLHRRSIHTELRTVFLQKMLHIRDTNCTAAVLRAKSCVMKTAAVIQENAEDIYAGAKQINEEREAAAEAAVVADAEAEEAAETTEETEA